MVGHLLVLWMGYVIQVTPPVAINLFCDWGRYAKALRIRLLLSHLAMSLGFSLFAAAVYTWLPLDLFWLNHLVNGTALLVILASYLLFLRLTEHSFNHFRAHLLIFSYAYAMVSSILANLSYYQLFPGRQLQSEILFTHPMNLLYLIWHLPLFPVAYVFTKKLCRLAPHFRRQVLGDRSLIYPGFAVLAVTISQVYYGEETRAGFGMLLIVLSAFVLQAGYFDMSAVLLQVFDREVQMNLQNRYLHENYAMVESRLQETLRLRHDLLAHGHAIHDLLREEKLVEAKEYLQGLKSHALLEEPVRYVAHDILNGLIYRRVQQMEDLGIRHRLNFDLPASIPIRNVDLISLLSNVLDNAIENSSRCAPGEATLDFSCKMVRQMLFLHCKNSAIEKAIPKAGGGFRTHKKDRDGHGLGFTIMHYIVERYDGEMRVESKPDSFTIDISLSTVASKRKHRDA